jgi:hypothetical protein
MIQYAATSLLSRWRLGILGPRLRGDDMVACWFSVLNPVAMQIVAVGIEPVLGALD